MTRSHLAAPDLDDQIGAAGEEAPSAPKRAASATASAPTSARGTRSSRAALCATAPPPETRLDNASTVQEESAPPTDRPTPSRRRHAPASELGQPFDALADHLGWPSRALSAGAPCHHASTPFQGGQAMRIRLRSGSPAVAISPSCWSCWRRRGLRPPRPSQSGSARSTPTAAWPPLHLPLPGRAPMAAKEINDAGGVMGRPLEFIFRDDKLKPDEAVKAARELVGQEKVETSWPAASRAASGWRSPRTPRRPRPSTSPPTARLAPDLG